MSFTLWATPFVDLSGLGSKVPAAFLNQIRLQINNALDGASGGAYAPTAPILINGPHGLSVLTLGVQNGGTLSLGVSAVAKTGSSGTFRVESGGQLRVQNGGDIVVDSGGDVVVNGSVAIQTGGQLEIENGGLGLVDAGAFVQVGGEIAFTSSGVEVFESGAHQTFQSGSTSTVAFGANLHVAGIATVQAGGTLAAASGGEIDIGSGALLAVESGGAAQIQSGGGLAALAGSSVDVSGGMTLHASSTAIVSGALEYQTAAILYDAGTTITGTKSDATTTNRSGTWNITGPDNRSGPLAYVDERPRYDITDANVGIDPWNYEVAYLTTTLTADRILVLHDPPGGALVRLRVMVAENQLAGHTLFVQDASGNVIVAFDGSAGNTHFGWAELRSRTGGWMILGAGRINLGGSYPNI
jgi:hypothetical protein